jgi:hypothetical protein
VLTATHTSALVDAQTRQRGLVATATTLYRAATSPAERTPLKSA